MEKLTLAFSLLLVACVPPTAPIGQNEGRGTWKADKADELATCEGYCGGRSPGRCYCDRACTGWGDCCPDYAPVCSGPADGGFGTTGGTGGTTGWGGPDGGTSDMAGYGTTGWGGTSGGTTGYSYDGGSGDLSGYGTTGWGGTSGGTTGYGGYDMAGYGTTGGTGGTSGGTTGFGGTNLGGPSHFFYFTLTVPRVYYVGTTAQPAINAYVYFVCNLTPTTIECGGPATTLEPDGTFSAYDAAWGTLGGQLTSPTSVDLHSYSNYDVDAYGNWFYDYWTGNLTLPVY